MTAHASPSPAAWLSAMIPLWNQQAMLGAEASQVVARRLWLIALGDPRAAAESQRMVTEKIEALGQVWWDMARVQADALMRGRPAPAPHIHARRAVQTYRRKVRANLRRLSG
ncbi:hypothetical protein [Novosphingobium pokkalii]|uniref:Uncharacterized protein n=1 Tax=Novosphingobium pokkalii TaxID=1770194 RepID=A0ABV7V893_9SPHN|nr:hypothetical protein [Novosphingobium pokkalii]GHC98876.1 hypothetical protein GCM10019060_31120 [Novosphingobium pokkalii]